MGCAMGVELDWVEKYFGDLWPHHNIAFNSLIIEGRRMFGGDLDALLIMSVVGERTLTAQRAAGLSYAEFREGIRRPDPPKRTNVQSIADFSGIPRETVRRKVDKLVEIGWLTRGPKNTLQVTPKAKEDLRPLTELTLKYLQTVTARVREIDAAGADSTENAPGINQTQPNKGRKSFLR